MMKNENNSEDDNKFNYENKIHINGNRGIINLCI